MLIMTDSTGAGRNITQINGGWMIRLASAEDVALMGCEWIPLPLTGAASEATVRDFVAKQVH